MPLILNITTIPMVLVISYTVECLLDYSIGCIL